MLFDSRDKLLASIFIVFEACMLYPINISIIIQYQKI